MLQLANSCMGLLLCALSLHIHNTSSCELSSFPIIPFLLSKSTMSYLLYMFCICNHIHGTHSSERKGDREKRTSDRARTRDLCSIVEFQPREPRRPVEILRPPSPLCTGHRCTAIQQRLRPAPRGWYCVLCDGSRLSGA